MVQKNCQRSEKNIGWSPEGTQHPKNSKNLDNWYGPGTGRIDILNHLELARETDGQIHEPMTKKIVVLLSMRENNVDNYDAAAITDATNTSLQQPGTTVIH